MKANTITEVIDALDQIIADSEKAKSRLGYFPALYKMVTERVREEVNKPEGQSIFEDPARMEKLDVIFANRYLKAYSEYMDGKSPTQSWLIAFKTTKRYPPIVIQHLFLGMNAHIGLDLGIAAAQVCKELGQPIETLQKDFNSINTILSSLVEQVEKELSMIWKPLKYILALVPFKLDHLITSFSMELARDKAWNFTLKVFHAPDSEVDLIIAEKDAKVAKYAKGLAFPPIWLAIPIFFIRVGENFSITKNIQYLNNKIRSKILESL